MTVKPPPFGVLLSPTMQTRAPTLTPAPLSTPVLPAAKTPNTPAPLLSSPSSPLSLSPRLPLVSVDAKTTPMSPTALSKMLSTTASQAHLAVIEQKGDARSKHALAAGVLSMQGFFRVAAHAQFGDRAGRPISYAAFRQSLSDHGLQTEWRTMLDVMPAALRAKHLAGKASPNELYDAWATDRATWRASVEPMALEVLTAEHTCCSPTPTWWSPGSKNRASMPMRRSSSSSIGRFGKRSARRTVTRTRFGRLTSWRSSLRLGCRL